LQEGNAHEVSAHEEAATNLLTSPIERTFVNRVFVLGGPFGLLVAIVLSLWVSHMRVQSSVIVQVDQQWTVGAQLAIRAQLVDGKLNGVEDTQVEMSVRLSDGSEVPLGELEPAPKGGLAQGTFVVPQLPVGVVDLELRFVAPGKPAVEESISIQVADERTVREGTHTVSASTLQWSDDTDPQPAGMRIDLRPQGRLLAGFTNRLLVRITHEDGTPWTGPVEVVLIDGEFMGKKGQEADPPRLLLGGTNALGLLAVSGPLTSEVLRVEVRVLGAEDPGNVVHRRRFRMVSYAGAVNVDLGERGIAPSMSVEVRARGLSGKRPVFVDVYDQGGAWIDTLQPPVIGAEPPRQWRLPEIEPGIVQFEAYHYTNSPGESTAIARLQITGDDPGSPRTLAPLIERQRARLDLPRVEKSFDAAHERAYFDALVKGDVSPTDVALARAWLLGTLPVQVFGPPTALVTRAREESCLAAEKRTWTLGLRWFLLGGGGLFLAVMTGLMLRSHARAAERTLTELQGLVEDGEHVEMAQHVRVALRAALLRGAGVIAVMASALILTVMLLESLLWEF